jgi:hypothetical protein
MTKLRKKASILSRFLMIALTAANLGSLVARADVYAIDTTITSSDPTGNPLQTDTVNGSITTDGTLGVLGAGNILSWNLDLTDALNAANDIDLTDANSSIVTFSGTALTATATGLFFDYSGTGEFGIQEDGFTFSGEHYFCFSTGVFACLAGETIAPGDVFVDGVVATGAASPVGTQPLGPPPPVPEPSSVILFSTLAVALKFSETDCTEPLNLESDSYAPDPNIGDGPWLFEKPCPGRSAAIDVSPWSVRKGSAGKRVRSGDKEILRWRKGMSPENGHVSQKRNKRLSHFADDSRHRCEHARLAVEDHIVAK